MKKILSLGIERTVRGTLTAFIFQHDDPKDPGSLLDIIDAPNFMELMWSVSDAHPNVTAVRHDGKLDFPDEISVGEAAECLFYDIIRKV